MWLYVSQTFNCNVTNKYFILCQCEMLFSDWLRARGSEAVSFNSEIFSVVTA